MTTEVGRQPWTVTGLLRTSESVSPLGVPAVAVSLAAFAVVYFAVFGFGIWYILRLMSDPPHPHEQPLEETIGAAPLGGLQAGGHALHARDNVTTAEG